VPGATMRLDCPAVVRDSVRAVVPRTAS
jgi:hypothetical protein